MSIVTLIGLFTLFLVVGARSGEAASAACTSTWAGGVGGDWYVDANWSPPVVPDAASDVCIPSGEPVVGSTTIHSLSVGGSGGALAIGTAQPCGSGPQTLTVTAGTTVLPDATVTLESSSTCFGGGDSTLAVTGGTLTNQGKIEALVCGPFGGYAGGTGHLAGRVVNTGTVAIGKGPVPCGNGHLIYEGSKTFHNEGTVIVTTSDSDISVASGAGATFTNDTGGTIASNGETGGQPQFAVYDGNTFVQGAGTTTGNPVLVRGASLTFAGAGASSFLLRNAVTLRGNIAAGQTVHLDQGECPQVTAHVTAPASISNAGTIGVLNIGGGCGGLPSLTIAAGKTLTNTGTLSLVQGGPGHPLDLQGNVVNTGTVEVTVANVLTYTGGTLVNQGSFSLASSATFSVAAGAGATFTNGAGGAVAVNDSSSFSVLSGNTFVQGAGTTTGNPVVVEDSALEYVGTGTSTIQARRTGTVSGDIAAGQRLTLAVGECPQVTAHLTAAGNMTNAGTIDTLGVGGCGGVPSLSFPAGRRLTNTGTFATGGTWADIAGDVSNSGQFLVGGSIKVTTKSYSQLGGTTSVASGGILDTTGNPMTIRGGTLAGNGTIVATAGVTNVAGSIEPGASPGTLTISNGYTQQSKGRLTIEIGGDGYSQFDHLNVGSATLAGRLVLAPTGGFKGTLGQTFSILSAPSTPSGTFSKVSKAVIDKNQGLYYAPTYAGSGVTLVVRQGTLSVPAGASRGSTVPVSGTGWLEGDQIKLTFVDVNGGNKVTKTVAADGSGSFSDTIAIPAGAAVGDGKITARSAVTALALTKTINIT